MCNFNEAEEETLKDKEPLEPVVPIVSLQSQPSQAKKAEVAPSKASTVKPSRISSKDAEVNNKTVDARFSIVLWEIVSLLSE
jgi:targeting protein for Xklp2